LAAPLGAFGAELVKAQDMKILGKCVPDRWEHLPELCELLGTSSTADFLSRSGYAGLPQHVSLWLCFSHGLHHAERRPLSEYRSELLEFKRLHGFTPEPVSDKPANQRNQQICKIQQISEPVKNKQSSKS
jgi:hypothetical protein